MGRITLSILMAVFLLVAASPWVYLLLFAGERFYAGGWTVEYFAVFLFGSCVSLQWWSLAWHAAEVIDGTR